MKQMHLSSIRLRNWKTYAEASFEFPAPTADRNVVLIEAPNGFGKTSFIEAITLGLYGRDGHHLVTRIGSDRERSATSYDGFLERALHAPTRGSASAASITLRFDDGSRDTLTLERVWHFTPAGRHLRADEEVRIWVGPDDDIIPVPEGEERDDFVRAFISNELLPVDLAPFFIFDGEQVQQLAGRDMAAQVRIGLESMLGVPVLRTLNADLRNYAKDRRRQVREADNDTLDRLQGEVRTLGAEEEALEARMREIEGKLDPLRSQREVLVRRIGTMHGDSYASLKTYLEARLKVERARELNNEQLRHLLTVDMALALTGRVLRQATQTQLEAENVRDRWMIGHTFAEERFGRFMELAGNTVGDPDLLKRSWHAVWNLPPDGAAEVSRHSYLSEAERLQVRDRLASVNALAGGSVRRLVEEIEVAERQIRKIDQKIAHERGVDDHAAALATSLEGIQGELAHLEAELREVARMADGLRGRLNPKRQELGRLSETVVAAAPVLRRAESAEAIAAVIERIIEEAYPRHVEALGAAVTDAYRAMAHKDLVERIVVGANGAVSMFDKTGCALQELDASAGESHVFALSLIAAITQVSERQFPIIMDSPLARLDPQHRHNVLAFFSKLDAQIILLSHPAEVSGEYLDLVKPRLGAVMEIKHEAAQDGVGTSYPIQLHLPEVA